MTVTLTNGDQPLQMGEIQLDIIDGGSPFSVRPDLGCTALPLLSMLPADASCDLTIDFVRSHGGDVVHGTAVVPRCRASGRPLQRCRRPDDQRRLELTQDRP